MDKKREKGGTDLALIRLTEKPYRQLCRHAPDSDYVLEGLEYLEQFPVMLPDHLQDNFLFDYWQEFKKKDSSVYVLRFEIIHLVYSDFLERAAIMEFEGKEHYHRAEENAYLLTQ